MHKGKIESAKLGLDEIERELAQKSIFRPVDYVEETLRKLSEVVKLLVEAVEDEDVLENERKCR